MTVERNKVGRPFLWDPRYEAFERRELAVQGTDDLTIDLGIDESEFDKLERRKQEDRDVIGSVAEGSFERLRTDPNCVELPKGVPLDIIIPGVVIIEPGD